MKIWNSILPSHTANTTYFFLGSVCGALGIFLVQKINVFAKASFQNNSALQTGFADPHSMQLKELRQVKTVEPVFDAVWELGNNLKLLSLEHFPELSSLLPLGGALRSDYIFLLIRLLLESKNLSWKQSKELCNRVCNLDEEAAKHFSFDPLPHAVVFCWGLLASCGLPSEEVAKALPDYSEEEIRNGRDCYENIAGRQMREEEWMKQTFLVANLTHIKLERVVFVIMRQCQKCTVPVEIHVQASRIIEALKEEPL